MLNADSSGLPPLGRSARLRQGQAVHPLVVAALPPGPRRTQFNERLGGDYTLLVYDSLELIPHLLGGILPVAVVVDLSHWGPLEAAPVLRQLREVWPAIRLVCLYEPTALLLAKCAELAASHQRLAFACEVDERLDLLLRPHAGEQQVSEIATAAAPLLRHLLPLAGAHGLESTVIHLALSPSRRHAIPGLAAWQGWSEDALERRCAEAGLAPPVALRRLAVAAEGLWQAAVLKLPRDQVAHALGLETGDSLGRVIKSVFGYGIKAARLMGVEGVEYAYQWLGLMALRELAAFGDLTAIAQVKLEPTDQVRLTEQGDALLVGSEDDEPSVRLEGLARRAWDLIILGSPLRTVVEGLSDADDPAGRFRREVVPTLRALLVGGLIKPG
jgi:hypothetical protein